MTGNWERTAIAHVDVIQLSAQGSRSKWEGTAKDLVKQNRYKKHTQFYSVKNNHIQYSALTRTVMF